MDFRISRLRNDDFERWSQLFEQYCRFYHFDCSTQKKATVCQWLFDANYPLEGFVIGILHYQTVPLSLFSLFGTDTGYLADLCVDQRYRQNGIATLLHEEFVTRGKAVGWPFTAWLTQETSSTARGMYDQCAELTDLRYYVQTLE